MVPKYQDQEKKLTCVSLLWQNYNPTMGRKLLNNIQDVENFKAIKHRSTAKDGVSTSFNISYTITRLNFN